MIIFQICGTKICNILRDFRFLVELSNQKNQYTNNDVILADNMDLADILYFFPISWFFLMIGGKIEKIL